PSTAVLVTTVLLPAAHYPAVGQEPPNPHSIHTKYSTQLSEHIRHTTGCCRTAAVGRYNVLILGRRKQRTRQETKSSPSLTFAIQLADEMSDGVLLDWCATCLMTDRRGGAPMVFPGADSRQALA
ncbi:unnamed protein product, partial [Ectocarpus sp. 13 AM-2016]